MNREDKQSRNSDFRVLCIGCGSMIRNDDREDASGLCLQCFYQLLNEHLRTQKVSRLGEFVSER